MTTSQLSVGCFGKLPHFGDFVKHNAGNREMQAFDQWLQQGILAGKAQVREGWNSAYNRAPAYHFLFHSEGAERLLVGIFQPSQDKSERKYPFFVSVLLGRAHLEKDWLSLIPVIFTPFFTQTRQFIQDARKGTTMPEIVSHTENLRLAFGGALEHEADRHRDYLAATTSESFWQQLFGNFNDPRKYLLFKNLNEILQPFRQGDPSHLTLGLRFPLGTNEKATGHDAAFWQQVCMRLLRYPGIVPVAFWTVPEVGKNAHLFLFFRPPAAKNFVQLVQPDLPSDIVCELEEEGKDKID
ncbi:MAG: type VI secretion system-associated protein TagF, partial [bacterium]